MKVSLYAVVDFTALIFGIVSADKSRTSGINHDYRFLLTRTLEIDLMCYLFLAGAALPEDDCVGIGCGYGFFLFLNLLPCLAFAW